jgi:PIN domain-containing protein
MGRKLAAELSAAGIPVIRHDDAFAENTPDEEWLTRAGDEGGWF